MAFRNRKFIRTTGITFGQGKSTVIKICENFMEALIRRKNEFIPFPEDTRDVAHTMRKMENVAGLPNVVGAIDGSCISIKAPHVNHEDYFNRKQNYSINLQGVVDADGNSSMLAQDGLAVFMTPEFYD